MVGGVAAPQGRGGCKSAGVTPGGSVRVAPRPGRGGGNLSWEQMCNGVSHCRAPQGARGLKFVFCPEVIARE